MKSNLIFSSLFAASLLFVSCKKEEEATSEASTDKPKEIIMPRVQAIPAQTTQQPAAQNVAQMQSAQPVTTGQPVALNQTPVVTKKGMNPPHGQPGHRCDIAVGAPLNSPAPKVQQPKAGSATVTQFTPGTTPTATTAAPAAGAPALLDPNAQTTTAPGMNPPHGQPGHQCGIAVGAPLPK